MIMTIMSTLTSSAAIFLALNETPALAAAPDSASAPAAAPGMAKAGKISDISAADGQLEVDVRTGTVLKTFGIGAPLVPGDTVITPAGTIATLTLEDDTRVVLGPASQFTVTKVAGSAGASSTFLKVTLGLARVWVKKIYNGDQTFRVSAGNSVMGVRGTSFVVEKDSETDTSVHTVEGKVLMARTAALLGDPKSSVTVEAGFSSSLNGSMRVPTPARSFKREELSARLDKRAPGLGKLFTELHQSGDDDGAKSVDYGLRHPGGPAAKAAPAKDAPPKTGN
ncbi:MAG: FecR domain-containing protein [Deltaproteobacteria bacterium]|nr:FecR domain-containing protein [Deltaproteobacteria bacterium]